MAERLTEAQLAKIVAEVGRLSLVREKELDRGQVEQVLQELNLPPQLLDEAMVQIHRREALAVQQRQRRWILGGIAVVVVGAIASFFFFSQQQQVDLARISTTQDRITLSPNSGDNLTQINRQQNPEVFYLVTLKDAPVGKRLSLSCDWVALGDQVVHQNRYQTKEITTPTWNTHCRYQIGTTAPTGQWTVKMFLEGRLLDSATFNVQ